MIEHLLKVISEALKALKVLGVQVHISDLGILWRTDLEGKF